MPKERACANDETRPVAPVTTWENEKAKGYALCAESLFRGHVEKVQALRDRQAEYLASLPTDPLEVLKAALKVLHPDAEEYPDGVEEALHLAYALKAMMADESVGEAGRTRDAAIYLADRIAYAMHRATDQLDRIADILGNPGRIERERHLSERHA